MSADPDHDADGADDAPECEHSPPVEQPAERGAALAAAVGARLFLFRPRRGFAAWAATCVARLFRRTANAVLRADAKFEALGGAAALAAVSPGHVPSPSASLPRRLDRRRCALRASYWRIEPVG